VTSRPRQVVAVSRCIHHYILRRRFYASRHA
jgi:hypothetical protein